MFKVILDPDVELEFDELRKNKSNKRVVKAVIKTLDFMRQNIKHPSLHTHKYNDYVGPNGEEIFESYAQNKTSGAYRVFWYYGPKRGIITVIAIEAHP